MSRLPVGPLQEAVLASGVPLAKVCRQIGMVRVARNSVDTTRLRRSLALADTGGGYRNRTVDRDLAVRVCAAIGRSLEDVFGVVPEVCAECGDELVGSPDGLCGFCRKERAGVAA
jgi:hypothetical protein